MERETPAGAESEVLPREAERERAAVDADDMSERMVTPDETEQSAATSRAQVASASETSQVGIGRVAGRSGMSAGAFLIASTHFSWHLIADAGRFVSMSRTDSKEEDATQRPGTKAEAGDKGSIVLRQEHLAVEVVGGTTPRVRANTSNAADHRLTE